MERLTSRKNETVRRLRALANDRAFRQQEQEYVCDGEKLLEEALRHGIALGTVLWAETPRGEGTGKLEAKVNSSCRSQWTVPASLLDYISPMKHAAGVLFTAKMRPPVDVPPGRTLVVDSVQDPGNLGAILRTANGLFIDTVIFTGACADVYGPKAVRASMGAVFRQRFLELPFTRLREFLAENGLHLYGATLSPLAEDIRHVALDAVAVAVGSEGQGLCQELLSMCDGELMIPMAEDCESLNAAVAAGIILWELQRDSLPVAGMAGGGRKK